MSFIILFNLKLKCEQRKIMMLCFYFEILYIISVMSNVVFHYMQYVYIIKLYGLLVGQVRWLRIESIFTSYLMADKVK